MTVTLNNREAEVEIDSNADGSRFAAQGYWNDGAFDELSSKELDAVNEECDDVFNAMFG